MVRAMSEEERAEWQRRYEAEQAADRATAAAFYAKMRDVAQHLGYIFYLEADGLSWLRPVELRDPHRPGWALYARLAKGRVTIGGLFHNIHEHVRLGHDNTADISVNAARPPVEIAREITRRLLPAYAATRAVAEQRKAGFDNKAARAAEILARLKAAAGPTATGDVRTGGAGIRTEFDAGERWPAPQVRGEISQYQGETVELHFEKLPIELAEQLLLIFGEYCT